MRSAISFFPIHVLSAISASFSILGNHPRRPVPHNHHVDLFHLNICKKKKITYWPLSHCTWSSDITSKNQTSSTNIDIEDTIKLVVRGPWGRISSISRSFRENYTDIFQPPSRCTTLWLWRCQRMVSRGQSLPRSVTSLTDVQWWCSTWQRVRRLWYQCSVLTRLKTTSERFS